MTSRILPHAEWSKLDETYLKDVWRLMSPTCAQVRVVEDGDSIIGCWTLQLWAHVEGVWVHPDHQKRGRVAHLLIEGMQADVLAIGAKSAFTGAASAEVTAILEHLGAEPLAQWVIPFQARADRARGHRFHRELVTAGIEPDHADDTEHDRQVGAALRLAFDEHQPEAARRAYNDWAVKATYAPISELSTDGDVTVVGFGPALTLRFDATGHLEGALICQEP
jgi:N-acetylglutamate synthase-like GNAT family acetyltransferase